MRSIKSQLNLGRNNFEIRCQVMSNNSRDLCLLAGRSTPQEYGIPSITSRFKTNYKCASSKVPKPWNCSWCIHWNFYRHFNGCRPGKGAKQSRDSDIRSTGQGLDRNEIIGDQIMPVLRYWCFDLLFLFFALNSLNGQEGFGILYRGQHTTFEIKVIVNWFLPPPCISREAQHKWYISMKLLW